MCGSWPGASDWLTIRPWVSSVAVCWRPSGLVNIQVRESASYTWLKVLPFKTSVSDCDCRLSAFLLSRSVTARVAVTVSTRPLGVVRDTLLTIGDCMPQRGSGPYRSVSMLPSGLFTRRLPSVLIVTVV